MTRRALLVAYRLLQPSFRYRMDCLRRPLEAAGWAVETLELPSGRYGRRLWENRGALGRADVTVLQQIKLSAPEAWLLRRLTGRAVFDLDDAIYVRKPRRLGDPADEGAWRRAKFRATCRAMDAVVVGNAVLEAEALKAGRPVFVLPTALDPAPYPPASRDPSLPPTVVWIGSPENLVYLELVRPALRALTRRFPTLVLKVICSSFPAWDDVRIERVTWNSASEAREIAAAHVGIMPLTDDAWSRGKCAFKLLQYMAAGLPCVASPVGANTEAVVDGVSGFLAADDAGWERALGVLLDSAPLRATMGSAGRRHLDAQYALEGYTRRYVELLTDLVAAR
jgi:glycosyltransferase involved in cell wall biosynthesis